MEDLIKTVSDIERVALPDITGLPAPSMSGRFRAAPIDKVCHASDDQFMSCWIEFRGDVVVLVKSDDSHKGVTPRSLGPKQAAFCCVVKAPPAAICTSPELNALAQRIYQAIKLVVLSSRVLRSRVLSSHVHACAWVHVRCVCMCFGAFTLYLPSTAS